MPLAYYDVPKKILSIDMNADNQEFCMDSRITLEVDGSVVEGIHAEINGDGEIIALIFDDPIQLETGP